MAEGSDEVTPYWEPVNQLGLIWRYRTTSEVLSVLTFYTMRGHKRASMWRVLTPTRGEKNCFSLEEAREWAEQ
jgi:hypothetical protein